jgi:hypothetical protein
MAIEGAAAMTAFVDPRKYRGPHIRRASSGGFICGRPTVNEWGWFYFRAVGRGETATGAYMAWLAQPQEER